MTHVIVWLVVSWVAAISLGWIIGRYGHGRCEPRAVLNDLERKCLAAELARTNNMRIKQ